MDKKPEILALDIATVTGFCSGRPGEKPTCGSIRLAPEGSPKQAIYSGMIKFLGQRLQAFRPDILIIEAPIGPGAFSTNSKERAFTNYNSMERLIGLIAVAEGISYACGIHSPKRIAVSTARKHFIGHGRLPSAEAKQAVFKRAQQLGYNPSDFDASDACCLWDYQCAQFCPRTAAVSGTLFRGQM